MYFFEDLIAMNNSGCSCDDYVVYGPSCHGCDY